MLVVTLFVNFLSGNIFQIKYLQKANKNHHHHYYYYYYLFFAF